MDAQRELLDSLMGKNRNEDKPGAEIHSYKDPRVCRNFLCAFCPYELFNNTKEDHGDCEQVHDEKFRKEFDSDNDRKKWHPWESDLLRELERFVSGCDRTIERHAKRLEDSGQAAAPTVNLETAAEVLEITAKIEEAMKKAEVAGEEGEVDESMRLMEEVEQLKQAKAEAQAKVLAGTAGKEESKSSGGSAVNQKLRVCEVCGAMLSIFDSDRRLADHFGGKVHLGYLRIREMVKTLREKREKSHPGGSDYHRYSASGRGDGRSRDRGRDYRDRDRDRHRDRGRDNRDYRDRRDRDRDRDRDRRRRSRSRSRDRRHRHPSRSRSRSRHRRHRD